MKDDWFANDDLFFRELEVGHRFAEYVAQRLREDGLSVQVTPLERRKDIDDRVRFVDEFDLKVGSRDPCVLDVKSRALAFRGPSDYPYDTALVDTVAGWAAKDTVPKAVVLVSQSTKGMAVVPVRTTRSLWVTRTMRDRVRRIDDDFYLVDRQLLRPFDELVRWLKGRETPGA